MNEMQSLYDGISDHTQSILRGALSRQSLAWSYLGMQESTGDLKLNVPSGRSQGLCRCLKASWRILTRMAKYFHLRTLS
jgi:hypothetical protein